MSGLGGRCLGSNWMREELDCKVDEEARKVDGLLDRLGWSGG